MAKLINTAGNRVHFNNLHINRLNDRIDKKTVKHDDDFIKNAVNGIILRKRGEK